MLYAYRCDGRIGLRDVSGALVTEVRPGTAAEAAGLQIGDTIVEFDGVSIDDPRKLQSVVEQAELDAEHERVVIRNGERMQFEPTLQALPETVASGPADNSAAQNQEFNSFGLELSKFIRDSADQMGIGFESGGILISGVRPSSAADRAGLRSGMVIRRVGNTDVSDIAGFQSATGQVSEANGLLLLVSTAN